MGKDPLNILLWRSYHNYGIVVPYNEQAEIIITKKMIRNVHIILGINLQDHAEKVVYWTGEFTGGTGHGLRIAEEYGIKIEALDN